MWRNEKTRSYLDPSGIRIFLDQYEDLVLELKNGFVYKPLEVQRAFPLTQNDHYIVLRNTEGDEFGIIRNMSDLDSESRKALTTRLDLLYFTPKIIQVNFIKKTQAFSTWYVETDRGPKEFEGLRNHEIRALEGGRILILDADGNQYVIPDYRKLDPVSRAIVETQI